MPPYLLPLLGRGWQVDKAGMEGELPKLATR